MKTLTTLISPVIVFGLSITAGAAPTSSFNFKVSLDDKPIGYHQIEVSNSDSKQHISSDAQFDVKLLFITAFKYRHLSEEHWNNNCLTAIDATTRSNGKRQVVKGQSVNDILEIDGSAGSRKVSGCVQSFAYWNPSILQATKLLNSQTGDYVDVEVTPLGRNTITLGEVEIETKKYRLASSPEYTGKPIDITLWYDASNMQWIALESLAKGKRKLRYELDNPLNPKHNELLARSTNASSTN